MSIYRPEAICAHGVDWLALLGVGDLRTRHARAKSNIVVQGDRSRGPIVVCEGWAFRCKELADGRRQIVGILLPGDLLLGLPGEPADCTLEAVTSVYYAEVPPAQFTACFHDAPEIVGWALLQRLQAECAIQREWINNLGQRPAFERLAHLLCEIHARLRATHRAEEDGCDFPLTQQDLAFICGLSPVHVNRTVQSLRAAGLVELNGRHLRFPDPERLRKTAQFDPSYLRIESPSERAVA